MKVDAGEKGKVATGNLNNCCGFVTDPINDGQGLHNTPGDSGGWTAYSITQKTLSLYLGRPATFDDLAALTPQSVIPILTKFYWNPVDCDALPLGLDLMVFDHACAAGGSASEKVLQTVLRVDVDGWVGPITLGAVKDATSSPATTHVLIGKLAYAQQIDYEKDAGFGEFGRGWLARLDRRVAAALAMTSLNSLAKRL